MNKYLSRAIDSIERFELFMVIGGVLTIFIKSAVDAAFDLVHEHTGFDIILMVLGATGVIWNIILIYTVFSRARKYKRDKEERLILEKLEDV